MDTKVCGGLRWAWPLPPGDVEESQIWLLFYFNSHISGKKDWLFQTLQAQIASPPCSHEESDTDLTLHALTKCLIIATTTLMTVELMGHAVKQAQHMK